MIRIIFFISIFLMVCTTMINTAEPEESSGTTETIKTGMRFATMSDTTFRAGMIIVNPAILITMVSIPTLAYREFLDQMILYTPSDTDEKRFEAKSPFLPFTNAFSISLLGLGITCDLIAIGLFIASAIFDKKARGLLGDDYTRNPSFSNTLLPVHTKVKNAGIMCLVNGSIGLLSGIGIIIGTQVNLWYIDTIWEPQTIERIKEENKQLDPNDYDISGEEEQIQRILNKYYGENEMFIAGAILISAGVILDIAGIIMMSASYLVKQKADLKNKYTLKPIIGISDKNVNLGCSILL